MALVTNFVTQDHFHVPVLIWLITSFIFLFEFKTDKNTCTPKLILFFFVTYLNQKLYNFSLHLNNKTSNKTTHKLSELCSWHKSLSPKIKCFDDFYATISLLTPLTIGSIHVARTTTMKLGSGQESDNDFMRTDRCQPFVIAIRPQSNKWVLKEPNPQIPLGKCSVRCRTCASRGKMLAIPLEFLYSR